MKKSAARRLVDPSLGVLAAVMKLDKTTQMPLLPAQALAAARDVLDRTGHQPPDPIDLNLTTSMIDLDQVKGMSSAEITTLRTMLAKRSGRAAAPDPETP